MNRLKPLKMPHRKLVDSDWNRSTFEIDPDKKRPRLINTKTFSNIYNPRVLKLVDGSRHTTGDIEGLQLVIETTRISTYGTA